ncbi:MULTISPECIES: hypothetical protein [Pseudomonas]|uniref:hypothetical protein n=1 Tax=Pseudomonas TaxID=286 RepID=UPI001B32D97B|nr:MULTISPECIES: hypothetical protein [Pseudomonas]MBP5969432.1 hypothetical protein [Pseudomonas iridis]MCA4965898.1 hypothetical protein [Pseudomonas sp. Y24-6]
MKKPFVAPRLVGARFDDHTIPLELLKDLAALEEFVVAVAKWKFVQQHGRVRTPKGFTDHLSINLSSVGEGSAVPNIVIEYNDPTAGLFAAANEDYFFQAVQSIGNAIDAAERGTPITEHVPATLLGYFDRFGRGLRDGEVLEFRPGTDRPARLSKLTRRRLLLASQNQILTDEVTVRGLVPEIDQAKMSFELLLPDGKKITAKMDAIHLDTILEATRGFRDGLKISVSGVGRFDRMEKLHSLDLIEDAVIIESNDPLARLDELRLLRVGWLDGRGVVPSPEEFDWIESFFRDQYPATLPTPFIYPTAEGGFQFEWRTGNQDLSLEIIPQNKTAELHGLNIKDGADTYMELNLEARADVDSLIDFISKAAKGEV